MPEQEGIDDRLGWRIYTRKLPPEPKHGFSCVSERPAGDRWGWVIESPLCRSTSHLDGYATAHDAFVGALRSGALRAIVNRPIIVS